MMKEGTLKKRRRGESILIKDESHTKSTSGNSAHTADPWQIEELEVEHREPERDAILFRQTTDEIRKLMKEILDLKTLKDTDDEITEKRIRASLLFISLKKLNRLEKLRSKKARDATNEAKQRVDSFQLQLQNLLYESLHLKKEVDKCLEFKSKDEEIELVPTEEFYREAPTAITKPDITKNDPHQLMLARLDWELEQRKRLAAKCEEAQSLKTKIMEEIKTKREYLENLAPRLNSILQATRPLQDYLDMPLDAQRTQHKMSRFLPRPLFILYVQASSYNEASDKHLTVTVVGDVDEAEAVKDAEDDKDEESGDSDMEESVGEQRHRVRSVDRQASKRKKLLQKHPLSVVLRVKCQGKNSLTLNFSYIMTLHIVTVTCKLHLNQPAVEGIPAEVLSPDSLLTCLFPDDVGTRTPNPTNHYQLQKLGMQEFSEYITEIGHPYLWAQKLAGLNFLSDDDTSTGSTSSRSGYYLQQSVHALHKISASHIEQTIMAIRQRFHSRLALHQQIAALVRGIVPISPDSVNLFPTKISSHLVSWKSVQVEDVLSSKKHAQFLENGILSSSSSAFMAQVERGSAKLKALVIISPDYPRTSPTFHVTINLKYERSAENDDSLRALERELNVFSKELTTSSNTEQLLTNQLQRLLTCFDIYLETETGNEVLEGPVEFPKEKVFLRPHRGRDRIKPYNYISKYGLFVHR